MNAFALILAVPHAVDVAVFVLGSAAIGLGAAALFWLVCYLVANW